MNLVPLAMREATLPVGVGHEQIGPLARSRQKAPRANQPKRQRILSTPESDSLLPKHEAACGASEPTRMELACTAARSWCSSNGLVRQMSLVDVVAGPFHVSLVVEGARNFQSRRAEANPASAEVSTEMLLSRPL